MSKGFWIITTSAGEATLLQHLLTALTPLFPNHGAKLLAQDTRIEDQIDGSPALVQVVEFPSLADAQACLASQGYQMTSMLRDRFDHFHIVVVEQASF